MGLGAAVREAWGRVVGVEARSGGAEGERKTSMLPVGVPGLLHPFRGAGAAGVLPKATASSLRRFAETPVARRAINCIKDRIACMDWRIEVKAGLPGVRFRSPTHDDEAVVNGAPGRDGSFEDRNARAAALTAALAQPNATDSFRTLIEQVIEDLLVTGCGAVEMESTGSGDRLLQMWPVDGASIQVNAEWDGDADGPRFGQVTGRVGSDAVVPLRDDELMYVRLNPRTHSVFGLGKLEVAFESINHFLQAHRYAARVAGNGVTQYALWMKDRTPEQQERLTRWWQEEIEGSGSVPVLSTEEQPQVLRLAAGTDAELRLGWQEFLLQMIANAFDLPAMMLGVSHDVNRSTAEELANEAFQNAVVPLAKLIAEHITRDVIAKKLGWSDLRFVWSDLESKDPAAEVDMQVKLLAAGVLTLDEVRAMRGLGKAREQGPGAELAANR